MNSRVLIPIVISILPQVVIKDGNVIPMSIFIKYDIVHRQIRSIDNLLDLFDQLPDCIGELVMEYYCYDLCYMKSILYVSLHELLPDYIVDKICSENDSACIHLHHTMIIVADVTYVKSKNGYLLGIYIEPELDIT